MPALDTALIVFGGIALFAAFVNGAIGYGFSSLTVPLALVFYTNRILNPAVVLVEVFLNLYVLFINRDGVPAVWRRVCPVLIGLLPGIAIGAYVLALVQPGWIKLGTYIVILPLILIQAAGWRRPIRSTWLVGVPFGTGLGVLYSVTTISGPPLAILFNNQGLVKTEFRAGLALVRVAEFERDRAGVLPSRPVHFRKHKPALGVHSERAGRNTARRLFHAARGFRDLPPHLHELRCMGGRLRAIAGADRVEFDGEPVGVWRDGGDDFDRRVFAGGVFHAAQGGGRARIELTCDNVNRGSRRLRIQSRLRF